MSETGEPIRVSADNPTDAERAARLERFYNWLYKTNPDFRKMVDSIASAEAILWALANDEGHWPPT